jgi:hypothetical protein
MIANQAQPTNEGIPCLPVVRTLGGCGGTLLTRFFGALSGTVVLSESNPRSAALYGGFLNPIRQIQDWHPDLRDSIAGFDYHEIGYPPRFGEMLERLYAAVKAKRLTLIIRDYNYVDFIGIPYLWPVPGDFSLDISVAGRFHIRDFLFVRSPAAQLASLRTHGALKNILTAGHFLESYQAFLAAKPNTPIFRYEDFVAKPGATFQKMCATLGIRFEPTVLERYSAVDAVTGNLMRNAESSIALPEPSEAARQAESELRKLPSYGGLLDALGYRS